MGFIRATKHRSRTGGKGERCGEGIVQGRIRRNSLVRTRGGNKLVGLVGCDVLQRLGNILFYNRADDLAVAPGLRESKCFGGTRGVREGKCCPLPE